MIQVHIVELIALDDMKLKARLVSYKKNINFKNKKKFLKNILENNF